MRTQKVCQTCKQNIGVANKKCRQCGAIQPYKENLAKQKEKVANEWKAMQQKNHSINKVYDSTHLLLHKWKMLDRRPILLLAKRGTNGFAADCICPWPIETEDGKNALITIKRIYESVLNGSFNHTGRNGRRPRIRFLVCTSYHETDTEFTLSLLTPVSSDLTPALSSDLTPALSSDLTPALSSDLTPALSSDLTPAISSDLTPALMSHSSRVSHFPLQKTTEGKNQGGLFRKYFKIRNKQ
ncbi:hypothetical protein F7725_017645 [Dissostichus mawsoni]|uniref:Uncharacterized protein n=1 Tax=Dissostichus mawsoni TaxID=36200 RepID=A0A7J5Z515_DISMA|nr:hypothetical protein F7725_017645 [Dissostichus mawsoni]